MDPKNAPADNTPATDDADDFDSVFDSLTDKDTKPHEQEDDFQEDAGAAGTAANDDQPGESGDGEDAAAQPAATGGDAVVEDGAGQPADGNQPPAGGDAQPAGQQVDWEARFRELEARIQAQPAAAPAQAPAPATAAPAAPAQEETPIYSAEEQAELAELQESWPEAHRLFSLLARQLQVDTLKYAFSEVDRVVAPLQQTVGTYAADDHMAAIYDAHSDYDQVYQPVMEWIGQQPSFLKAAYENVVQQGTAQDVNDMIARFKQETQWKPPATTPPARAVAASPAATPAAASAGLSDAAKQAAKAMGAVGTKRGAAVSGAVDPNDFDGAWAEAVSNR